MESKEKNCPKCQVEMQQGFVLDNTYGARLVSQWSPGQPLKSFWVGTKRSEDELIPIGTFRCKGCGYLESYAMPDYAAS